MNKITMKEKISYGIGDLACNTLFTVISSYLMFFYTDIAGIGLAAVGTIMLVSRVVDAVTDPLMGNIVDRTNTKWGKARPYVLWMAVPFAISGVLMFTVPDLSSQGKFIYALITYVLFCVVYTALNIPYTTMLSNLTDDSGARLSFNMFKMIGSSAGAFIASGVTLSLVEKLGGTNRKAGFAGAIAVYGVVGVVLLIICFKNTKERIVPIQEKITLRESLSAAAKNKPWVLLCAMSFVSFTGLIIKNQGTMYYAKYYLENEKAAASLLAIPNLLAIPLAFVVPAVAMKIGKRNCVLWGNVIFIGSLAGTFLAGKSFPLLMFWAVLGAVGLRTANAVPYVMMADAIDYSEWKTGIRPQGLLTSFSGFMVKLGMAAAGVIGAAVMSAGGYVENAVQSASSVNAIRANFIWIPMALSVVCVILSLLYDLDKKYPKIIEELHQRKAESGR